MECIKVANPTVFSPISKLSLLAAAVMATNAFVSISAQAHGYVVAPESRSYACKTGKNANCGITVGVLTGAQNRAQIQEANPTYIIESLNELIAILF